MNTRKFLAVTLLTLAFFPVLKWYWLRLGDGGGETFGLIALALALFFNRSQPHAASPRLAEISLLIYALSLFFLPPLLRSIPALGTIAFLSGMHRRAGQFGLLLLSLPVQASLDFFLGYPFRLITAEGSRLLLNSLHSLRLMAHPVERLGVQLSQQGQLVSVDPPCSGLQMLWATALLSALLSALFRLTYRRSIQLSIMALALCLLANILRASFLFFPESGLISVPGFLHQGVGLIFFALASLLLCNGARRLQTSIVPSLLPAPQNISHRLQILASGTLMITLLPARMASPLPQAELVSLNSYQGRTVEETALSPREKSFAENFPGELKIYAVAHDTLIIRRITRASRLLHPSYHCLKAEGFLITHSRIEKDAQEHPVLRYQATRQGEAFQVSESIRNLNGTRQWTDVSAWYWHALFHPQSGPWEAHTLMTPFSP